MKRLLAGIKQQVGLEYERYKNTPVASMHEAYALVLEESQEANEEWNTFERDYEYWWTLIRQNERLGDDRLMRCTLESLQVTAERAAAEWVQVAQLLAKTRLNLAGGTCIQVSGDG